MNVKRYSLLLILSIGFLVSCSRSDDPVKPDPKPEPPVTETADKTNDFVWRALNSWYYWQPNVPNLADAKRTNLSEYVKIVNGVTPDKLFYSLLYEYPDKDQFSWIENNNEIVKSASFVAEVEKLSGIEVALFQKGGGSSNYVALVNYVIPNSSADQKGIKRGDVITKVNGSHLTSSNYNALFSDSFSITRAETASSNVVGGYYVITTTDRDENISISKSDIDENPIAHYQVFNMGGKKIGYLVFNGFKIDYNDELNQQFLQMKNDGISELILDLRYNGGGSLDTALGLAQMINGSYTGQEYVYLDFNDKHNAYDSYDKLKSTIDIYNIVNGHAEKTGEVQPINSLTLPKIYALVSFQTASASELTVTSLQERISVETIGYYTVGKFVGSHTLYDSPNDDFMSYENRSKDHNWKLQPITFAYYAKKGGTHPTYKSGGVEYVGILPPDGNLVHPYEWVGKVKEFGNTSDPELALALEKITGTNPNASAKSRIGAVLSARADEGRLISKPVSASKGLYIQDMKRIINK